MTSEMTINKYQGKTKEEAIEKAKQELGEGAVVMNVKEIKPTGMFKAWKSSVFEVTAAKEEKDDFVDPRQVADLAAKTVKTLNLAADEKISPKEFSNDRTQDILSGRLTSAPELHAPELHASELHAKDGLEKRLENLSNILEKQLSVEESRQKEVKEEEKEHQVVNPEGLQFIKMLYRTLLENEVNEKYVNQILDEAEKVMHSGSSVDVILSNVYQKMILKLGQPDTICVTGKKPRIIFFVGPTGVGKTTTIAKIASKYKLEMGMKIAFLTADTYRIAATEQLRVYANILDAPMSIIYSSEEMNAAIERVSEYDLIFVDTAGFSRFLITLSPQKVKNIVTFFPVEAAPFAMTNEANALSRSSLKTINVLLSALLPPVAILHSAFFFRTVAAIVPPLFSRETNSAPVILHHEETSFPKA